jgi:16S rRNA (guanine527-N7)-methyltransferase
VTHHISPADISQRLSQGASQLGMALTPLQIVSLQHHLILVAHWSKAHNLTAIRDPLEMVGYHALDSLALAPFLRGHDILDIGTGAGFPGLPLAITSPDRHFTLLDSSSKKIRFIRHAISELALPNVCAAQYRIESYATDQKFDTIMTRALTSLSQFLAWAEPLLKRPGVLLAPKGPRVESELANLRHTANPMRVYVHHLSIPFVQGARVLVTIEFS